MSDMRKRHEAADPDSTFNRAADDEPIFVLRSTDKGAPGAVLAWVERAAAAGTPSDKLRGAMALFLEMIEWQRANPGAVKTPD